MLHPPMLRVRASAGCKKIRNRGGHFASAKNGDDSGVKSDAISGE
jgi:hypothetical protein